jgi:ABC-type bacteriocin/lantibiotic exporter with double-glycine peptidase domain
MSLLPIVVAEEQELFNIILNDLEEILPPSKYSIIVHNLKAIRQLNRDIGMEEHNIELMSSHHEN